MVSATDFLPCFMIEFMNFDTTTSPNLGSGLTSRLSALWRRDIDFSSCADLRGGALVGVFLRLRGPGLHRDAGAQEAQLLGPLGSVLGASLLAVRHTLRVEHAADDVVAHAGEVLDAATADHHHRVLLQVVALARDVADDLEAVGETYLGNLAQGRVRLLRRRCIDACANPALLRARLHVARLLAVRLLDPRLADQLLYRRHPPLPPCLRRAGGAPVRQSLPPRRDPRPPAFIPEDPPALSRQGILARNCPLLDDDSV